MNFELFIAKRVSVKAKRSFSRLIVVIAITGITLGLGVMISAFAIVTGFKSTIRDKIVGFSGHIQVNHIKVNPFDLNTSFENFPVDTYNEQGKLKLNVNSFPGLEQVQAYATKPGIISTGDEIEGVVLKGVGPEYRWDYLKEHLISGRLPRYSFDSLSLEVLVSGTIASRLKLETGDDFLIYFVQDPPRPRKLRISGIYQTGLEDLDKMYIIGDLKLVQRLNNWDNLQAGGYEIFIKETSQLEKMTDLIHTGVAENLQAYSVEELNIMIFEWLSLLDINAQVILVLMLLVAGINMVSALLIMILERTNMIGTLKALGSSNISIRKIFIYQSGYLLGLGVLLGNILGLGFCILQEKYRLIGLDQTNYYMDYVPVELHAWHVILLNACTIVVCLIMLIVPSMLATRISPVKAIQFK